MMKHLLASRRIVIIALFLFVFQNSRVHADIYTGTINSWNPNNYMEIGDGVNFNALAWSIYYENYGWFYDSIVGYEARNSDVSFAKGVTDISQITDASIFANDTYFVGPASDSDVGDHIGDFIIWKNLTTNYYGVLRIDDIYVLDSVTECPDRLDGTWWFQSDGTGNFSGNSIEPVPVPGAFLLGFLGLGAAGLKLRREYE